MLGTGCTAIRNRDGTWDVLDLPVLYEGTIPRFNAGGELVDRFPTDVSWMEKVLRVHALREREGYLGRAFVDHHEVTSGSSQPDAGWIMPRRIGTVTVDGEAKPALFLDLLRVPDDVYQVWIKTGRAAYRSIESLHAESGFIDGLALMPTRPPHYRLPMLTIGREEHVPDGTEATRILETKAVACSSRDLALAAFNRERTMTKKTESKAKPKTDELLVTGTAPDGSVGSWVVPIDVLEKAAAMLRAKDDGEEEPEAPPMETEGETEEETEVMPEPETSGVEKILGKIRDGKWTIDEIQELKAGLEELLAAMGGGQEGAGLGQPEVANVPLAEQAAAGKAHPDERLIRAEAKATAADARAAAIEADMKLRDAVTSALEQLEDYNLGSNPRAMLTAKAKEHGIRGLELFVETILAHAPPSPGMDLDGMAGLRPENLEALPAEVLAYTDPADREQAIKAWRKYADQEARGFPMDGRSLRASIRREITKANLAARAR